ncbi:Bacterial/Archaeal Transporter family protein, partial [Pseudomonas sp. FEN]
GLELFFIMDILGPVVGDFRRPDGDLRQDRHRQRQLGLRHPAAHHRGIGQPGLDFVRNGPISVIEFDFRQELSVPAVVGPGYRSIVVVLLPRVEGRPGLVGGPGGQAQRGVRRRDQRAVAGREARPASVGWYRPDYHRRGHAGSSTL